MELGEGEGNDARRAHLCTTAEGYACRALSANLTDAEGHFSVARAPGRTALTLGKRDRVTYAAEVRTHAHVNDRARVREQVTTVARMAATEPNDARYKQQAAALGAKL